MAELISKDKLNQKINNLSKNWVIEDVLLKGKYKVKGQRTLADFNIGDEPQQQEEDGRVFKYLGIWYEAQPG